MKAKSFQLSELATMNPAQPMGWLTTLGSRRQPVGAPPMPVAVGSRVQGASGLALRAGVACPISVGCRSRGPNLDLLDRCLLVAMTAQSASPNGFAIARLVQGI